MRTQNINNTHKQHFNARIIDVTPNGLSKQFLKKMSKIAHPIGTQNDLLVLNHDQELASLSVIPEGFIRPLRTSSGYISRVGIETQLLNLLKATKDSTASVLKAIRERKA